MTRNFALFLSIITIACSAGFVACGSGSNDSAGAAQKPLEQSITDEMLQRMVPGVNDLPGLTRSDARLLDNEGASSQAPDPAARVAHLNEIGRVVGFHALFVPSDTATAGVPNSVTWSVNLFQQHAGALQFINEPLDAAEGVTVESLDVSSLGTDAVGFVVRNTDPTKTAVGYVIAFAEDTIEAGVTATYPGGDPSADYILGLAGQAQTLIQSTIEGQPAAQPSPSS